MDSTVVSKDVFKVQKLQVSRAEELEWAGLPLYFEVQRGTMLARTSSKHFVKFAVLYSFKIVISIPL